MNVETLFPMLEGLGLSRKLGVQTLYICSKQCNSFNLTQVQLWTLILLLFVYLLGLTWLVFLTRQNLTLALQDQKLHQGNMPPVPSSGVSSKSTPPEK